jgi:hypothetical protein
MPFSAFKHAQIRRNPLKFCGRFQVSIGVLRPFGGFYATSSDDPCRAK